jgi:tRNA modification GTPase
MTALNDTVFALASGPGRAGVAVWRLSGPLTGSIIDALAGGGSPALRPAARHAAYRTFQSKDGSVIDRGLLLWFPGPKSFTGEDMAEVQIHGGRAVGQALSAALIALGARPAEAGEFTRRAVLNGKIDLTAAEAIADLVAADTHHQRLNALAQGAGSLERKVEDWRSRLIAAAGYLEAEIDFAEEDIPDSLREKVARDVAALTADIAAALAESPKGERLRDGLSVTILGAPNAGKSSLLNRIAGREAAIVSDIAGTTRDVIDIHLDLGGWPVELSDTAGLRESADTGEAEGIRRALDRAAHADARIVVFDGSRWPELDPSSLAQLEGDALVVINKTDLGGSFPATVNAMPAVAVSAKTGEGIDAVLAWVEDRAEETLTGGGALFNRARHRAALSETVDALSRFDPRMGLEFGAEDLRGAARALGRITGKIVADDLLDVIFRDFCIGK